MLGLIVSMSSAYTLYGPTNSTWNYDNEGLDWTFTTCAKTTIVQSPIDITN